MLPSTDLKIVGCDPSLRNWGLAMASYNVDKRQLTIDRLQVVSPVLPTSKQVRQNSLDLESANQLYRASLAAVKGAHAVFAEVPVGSQNARAMASYGTCVGVLGAMRATGIPLFEVTYTEVKQVATGKKDASKREMIQWAMDTHPEAPWPMQTRKGVTSVIEGSAEHMADAVAAIYAGIYGNQFQQLLSLMTAKP